MPTLNLASTNTITYTGWFNSNTSQNSYTGLILYTDASTREGIHISGTQIGYDWNNNSGAYGFQSGLNLPGNIGTFVAVVITRTNATLYMKPSNSGLLSVTTNLANPAEAFNTGNFEIGADSGSSSRAFNGLVDDVRIYDTSLSSAQITALAQPSGVLDVVYDTITASAATPGIVNVLTNDQRATSTTLSVTGLAVAHQCHLAACPWMAASVPTLSS